MPAPKKRIKRPALNLTVDHEVKAGGARAAYRRGKSLSQLVQDYLQTLIRADEEADRLSAPVARAHRTAAARR